MTIQNQEAEWKEKFYYCTKFLLFFLRHAINRLMDLLGVLEEHVKRWKE